MFYIIQNYMQSYILCVDHPTAVVEPLVSLFCFFYVIISPLPFSGSEGPRTEYDRYKAVLGAILLTSYFSKM